MFCNFPELLRNVGNTHKHIQVLQIIVYSNIFSPFLRICNLLVMISVTQPNFILIKIMDETMERKINQNIMFCFFLQIKVELRISVPTRNVLLSTRPTCRFRTQNHLISEPKYTEIGSQTCGWLNSYYAGFLCS